MFEVYIDGEVTDECAVERTTEGVAVSGELDLSNATEYEEQLSEAASRHQGVFTIDLSGVTFMGSAGVTAIMRAVNKCPPSDTEIQASRQVFTVLHIAGLARGFWPNVVVFPPADEPA
jgi:anti-anti-sigma factor